MYVPVVGHMLDIETAEELPVVYAKADSFQGRIANMIVGGRRLQLDSGCSTVSIKAGTTYKVALRITQGVEPRIVYIGDSVHPHS